MTSINLSLRTSGKDFKFLRLKLIFRLLFEHSPFYGTTFSV